MSYLLFSFWEFLIFLIFLIVGAYIFKNIAKENELDTSFRIAFTVVFLLQITSIIFNIVPILVIEVLRISGIMFNSTLIYVLIPFYIGIFGIILYIGILIIQKFYEWEFRESFSMLRLYFFYNIIVMIPLSPFVISFLNLNI